MSRQMSASAVRWPRSGTWKRSRVSVPICRLPAGRRTASASRAGSGPNVVQACVVTLEPVISQIDQELDQIFVPEGSRLARILTNEAGEMILDPEGPDVPETFTGDTIDAGALVAEFAALAIDPYPRKSGAAFDGHVEDSGESDRKPSPFAALKDWKKD